MVDGGSAVRRLAFRAERRSAGIDVDDAQPAGLRAGQPGARIAEIRPVHVAKADDLGPEMTRGAKVGGLDGEMEKAVNGRERKLGHLSLQV